MSILRPVLEETLGTSSLPFGAAPLAERKVLGPGLSRVTRAVDGAALLWCEFANNTLPSPADLFKRYLDIPLAIWNRVPLIGAGRVVLAVADTRFYAIDLQQQRVVACGTQPDRLAGWLETWLSGAYLADQAVRAAHELAEEYRCWFDLAMSAMGALSVAPPEAVSGLLHKVVFLWRYWRHRPEHGAQLHRAVADYETSGVPGSIRSLDGDTPAARFCAATWVQKAATKFQAHTACDALRWTPFENAMLKALRESRDPCLTRILAELCALDLAKLATATQTLAFSSLDDRLAAWRFATAEQYELPKRFTDMAVLDVSQVGMVSAFHMAVRHIREVYRLTEQTRTQGTERGVILCQRDLFQPNAHQHAALPDPGAMLGYCLESCVRFERVPPSSVATLQYLLLLLSDDLAREWGCRFPSAQEIGATLDADSSAADSVA